MPMKVPTMPWPRLKWPVSRVRSATTNGTKTANTAAVTPSRSCTTTSSTGLVTMAKSRPRSGNAAKPMSRSGRRPQICARVPIHGDSAATSICGTTMQAAINSVAHWLDAHGQHAAHQRQHGRIGEVEQQQAAGKDEQRPIAHQLAGFGPRLCAAVRRRRAMRPLGIDLGRRNHSAAPTAPVRATRR